MGVYRRQAHQELPENRVAPVACGVPRVTGLAIDAAASGHARGQRTGAIASCTGNAEAALGQR